MWLMKNWQPIWNFQCDIKQLYLIFNNRYTSKNSRLLANFPPHHLFINSALKKYPICLAQQPDMQQEEGYTIKSLI